MKMTKKLLVLLLTLVLAFSMVPSVFAQTTSDEVVCKQGEEFTVTFTVENVVGVQGTVSGGFGRGAVFVVTDLAAEGLTEGTIDLNFGSVALVSETPATLTLTATLVTSRWAWVEYGMSYPVTFDYQYTTDGTDLEWGSQQIYVTVLDPAALDYTALDAAIAAAEEILNGNTAAYTAESIANLQSAYDAAVATRESATTQDEIDEAANALLAAIEALEAKVVLNYARLKALLTLADSLDRTNYTEASWENMNQVRAVSRLALTYAKTQAEVDTAADNLADAIASLVKIVVPPTLDTSALEAAIAKAEALKESDYTTASWANLADALTYAKAALQSNDQSVIDAATTKLNVAISNLIAAPADVDYTALKAAIAAMEALNKTDYTTASWDVAYAAYLDAKAALYALDQTTVDTAAAALNAAVSSLVKMDLTALQAAIDAAKAYTATENAKSAHLRKQLEALFALGEALKTAGDQEAVNACAADINALLDAIKAADAVEDPSVTPPLAIDVTPADDTLWNVFFWIGVVALAAMVITIAAYLIVVLVVKKKKDDTPLVNYDINDDDQ